ncbi:outer membrane immunogenic protein [Mesorhizobium sp. NFR06]|uniref:outer membrane protein n=1 Tax=Mesorhizobium sp. NFR06 TaxID=1566290 RepID=UPI0008ECCAB3|nr:outer membrane protein [Mesorhizobium sp. NFR06]SFP55631.1 outer membrane immunogenic protein [Mesorhizobium sp. NFR06]
MKQIILATALVLATGTAYAADVLQGAPVAASFDWTGAYIGVNAGGGFGTFKHEVTGSPTSIDVSSSGFLGGVQAGYNWQSGQVVYGVETDFQGADIKGDLSFPVTLLKTKVDWFGTLRARIGFTPVDRFMVYGTGGLAYGHFETEINNGAISGSKTKAGWTVGAGAEYAINTNWTIKSEYLYTDLGKADVIDLGPPNTLTDKIAFHTVRVGLNYKF